MRVSPSACVVDANILIDLHVGRLLGELFQLPLEFISPNVIVEEELEELDSQRLVDFGLESRELSGSQLQEVVNLRQEHARLSANDLMAFVLARDLNLVLLTGDRHLRDLASDMGVPVHGTLWVLDELLRLKIVPPKLAIDALLRMVTEGGRFPEDDIQRRLRKWNKLLK